MIPQFDQHGLLPPGVHDCTLADIENHLCFTDRRAFLFQNLTRFVDVELMPLNLGCPLLIDGSFTRNKPNPDDIDVVLDLEALVGAHAVAIALNVRMRHGEIKAAYNLDVWTRHPSLPLDISLFFQYAGDKAAAELRLPVKHPKGLLRVMP